MCIKMGHSKNSLCIVQDRGISGILSLSWAYHFWEKKKEKMWDIFPNSHIVSNTIMCFFPNNALLFKLLLIAIPPWNTCLHFIISVIQAVTPEVNTNIHFFVSSVSLVLISTIDYFPYVQMFAPIVWQYRSTERVCSPYSLLRFFKLFVWPHLFFNLVTVLLNGGCSVAYLER